MNAIENLLQSLTTTGIIGYALPFILVFGLTYAILKKTEILGKDNKKINLTIALTFGLAALIPHYLKSINVQTNALDLVDVMSKALPQVSLTLIVILSVMIILGLLGSKLAPLHKSNVGSYIALFLIVLVILIFLFSANVLTKETPIIGKIFSSGNKELWNAVTGIAVFGIIVWLITKEKSAPNKMEKVNEDLKKLFKN